jgi:hypothetical protein
VLRPAIPHTYIFSILGVRYSPRINMRAIARIRLTGAALAIALGCTPAPASRLSLFSVPGGPTPPGEFYELPFPNDIRRGTDGRPDLTGYPHLNALVDKYTGAISAGLDGFGLNSAIFVRFGGPIDTASLPTSPEGSLADDAAVYLVNVDPTSPDKGRKTPLKFGFQQKEGSTIGPCWLSALPYPGFPLDEGSVYALIVTNRVHVHGSLAPVERSTDFTSISGNGTSSSGWASKYRVVSFATAVANHV